jgi:hypothetical protein
MRPGISFWIVVSVTFAAGVAFVASLSVGAAARTVAGAHAAAVAPACAGVNRVAEARLMRAYRNAGGYPARR